MLPCWQSLQQEWRLGCNTIRFSACPKQSLQRPSLRSPLILAVSPVACNNSILLSMIAFLLPLTSCLLSSAKPKALNESLHSRMIPSPSCLPRLLSFPSSPTYLSVTGALHNSAVVVTDTQSGRPMSTTLLDELLSNTHFLLFFPTTLRLRSHSPENHPSAPGS